GLQLGYPICYGPLLRQQPAPGWPVLRSRGTCRSRCTEAPTHAEPEPYEKRRRPILARSVGVVAERTSRASGSGGHGVRHGKQDTESTAIPVAHWQPNTLDATPLRVVEQAMNDSAESRCLPTDNRGPVFLMGTAQ